MNNNKIMEEILIYLKNSKILKNEKKFHYFR